MSNSERTLESLGEEDHGKEFQLVSNDLNLRGREVKFRYYKDQIGLVSILGSGIKIKEVSKVADYRVYFTTSVTVEAGSEEEAKELAWIELQNDLRECNGKYANILAIDDISTDEE